jgi:hypothetical protein
MTSKEQTLHHLYQARTAHIRWVNTIKLLVSGIDVPVTTIPLSPADSDFGRWYYTDAVRFSLGVSQMVLDEIETLLLAMHDKYTRIYPIYYGSKKKSLFGGLLGGRTKASEPEIEFSVRHYEEIVVLSDKLKHKLRIFESQLMSMGEEKFEHVPTLTALQAAEPACEPETSKNTYFYGTRGRG